MFFLEYVLATLPEQAGIYEVYRPKTRRVSDMQLAIDDAAQTLRWDTPGVSIATAVRWR
jgi:hypothetical protein